MSAKFFHGFCELLHGFEDLDLLAGKVLVFYFDAEEFATDGGIEGDGVVIDEGFEVYGEGFWVDVADVPEVGYEFFYFSMIFEFGMVGELVDYCSLFCPDLAEFFRGGLVYEGGHAGFDFVDVEVVFGFEGVVGDLFEATATSEIVYFGFVTGGGGEGFEGGDDTRKFGLHGFDLGNFFRPVVFEVVGGGGGVVVAVFGDVFDDEAFVF